MIANSEFLRSLYCMPFAWNPINLIEGEGKWVSHVAQISALASLITIILYAIKLKFIKYDEVSAISIPQQADNQSQVENKGFLFKVRTLLSSPIAFTIFTSIYTPLLTLLWYAASIDCIDSVTDGLLSHMVDMPYSLLIKIGAVVVSAWMLFRLKNGLIQLVVEKKIVPSSKIDPPTAQALSKIATIGIVFVVFVILHDVTGMSMTTVLAFGGVGGLALAFASQDIVANFFGGFMVHVTRPFIVGEDVLVPSAQIDGKIEELGWYQTAIRSTDKTSLYVPNSTFTKAVVINKSRMTHRLINEPLYVRISPDRLVGLLEELRQNAARHQGIDSRQGVNIWVSAFYGQIVKITIFLYVGTTNYGEYCRIREKLFVSIAESVHRHGGMLTPPPEMNDAWMRVNFDTQFERK